MPSAAKNPVYVPFLPPQTSTPGAVMHPAAFEAYGEKTFPFKGGRYILEPQCRSKPDCHRVRECWMIAKGRGKLNYDGEIFEVREGDYVHFEPYKTHQVFNDGEEPLVIHTVWWLDSE